MDCPLLKQCRRASGIECENRDFKQCEMYITALGWYCREHKKTEIVKQKGLNIEIHVPLCKQGKQCPYKGICVFPSGRVPNEGEEISEAITEETAN